MPRRVEDYRGLTHLSRLRLLHAVQLAPGSRLAELADRTGLHQNTAREHLAVLEREGLVTRRTEAVGGRGRPPAIYEPVDDVEHSPAAGRRAAEAGERGDRLRRISPALDHGDTRGEEAEHQLDTLYEHLDDAGFEPSLDEESLTLDVSPCRYLTAMDEDCRTVCSVHVRLIDQHLRQVPGPVELREVTPFVTDTRCTISLGLADDDAGPTSEAAESQTRSAAHRSGPKTS